MGGGLFLACATGRGRTLFDRRLNLQISCTDDRERCRRADIDDTVGFEAKAAVDRRGRAVPALTTPWPHPERDRRHLLAIDHLVHELFPACATGVEAAIPAGRGSRPSAL
ncbi:putative protein OS=Streptomyces aurantiogriseus OX=66870 GN=GCM10010251_11010 PE=4 SV=1 [Streptomyces aurantiogriseus]|uniref:Uncharacterized protein n=1 Tax=Streptomyces aurantiogriseus TaxID=66870 RepID=A0A918BXL2_9ACTN|nr:hypothetical protein GCM10010251_11010 [Streptomyces aurantiogriseus]